MSGGGPRSPNPRRGRRARRWVPLAAAAAGFLPGGGASAQGGVDVAGFTRSADGQVSPMQPAWPAPERLLDGLEPVADARRRLRENLGLDVVPLYLLISQAAPGEGGLVTGVFGVNARWELLNRGARDTGGLYAYFESRHNLTDDGGLQLASRIGTPFSTNDFPVFPAGEDAYTRVRQLYWRQEFLGDQLSVQVGKLDTAALYNRNRFIGNKWRYFLGQHLTTNPGRAFPFTGLGGHLEWRPGAGDFYLSAGLHDPGADDEQFTLDPGNQTDGVFAVAEAGLPTPGEGLAVFTLYHTAQRDTPGGFLDEGFGFGFSHAQPLPGGYGLGLRYAYADPDSHGVESVVAAGLVRDDPFGRRGDAAGLGVSWLRTSDRADNEQFTTEAFYRLRLAPGVDVSPNLELFLPTASGDDVEVVLGSRLSIVF